MSYYSPRLIPRRNSSYRRRQLGLGLGVALIFLVLFGATFGVCSAYKSTARTMTLHVKRLDDQSTGSGHQYMVFTDEGVFVDKDSLLFMKFDSSDVFNQLQEGHAYTCKVVGWRLHLTSNYPNIISCEAAP